MHVMELDQTERDSYGKALDVINALTDDERTAMLEHAAASVARFTTKRDPAVLEDWARGFLLTMRLHRSKAFAVAGGDPATFREQPIATNTVTVAPASKSDLQLAAMHAWRAFRGALHSVRSRTA